MHLLADLVRVPGRSSVLVFPVGTIGRRRSVYNFFLPLWAPPQGRNLGLRHLSSHKNRFSEGLLEHLNRTMAEQRLAMVNIVGFPRIFSKSVIPSPGRLERTVVNNPVASLGRLRALPNEILDMIISDCCDIQTIVTSFSLVNRGARMAINASLAFQRVSRYAPRALIAMLRTRAGSFFTLEDLCDVLCRDSSCSLCGNFGPLLWLPECRRCCMPCLYTAPELLPISLSMATTAFGVSEAVLASVPAVCTVPGQYGWLHRYYQDSQCLLSFSHARAVAVEDAGGEAQFMARINSVPLRKEAYKSFIAENTMIPWPENVSRYMVAASLPYFNRRSGKIVKGFSCKGCINLVSGDRWDSDSDEVDDDDNFRRYDTVYTRKGLIEHVQTDCPEGKRIWKRHLKKSKQGNGNSVSSTKSR
ncbi:uncharacterized protein EV420DRAFT_1523612 [Desarmillaria tabescens]|uniref:F-box domain-containing protein n=1 Tax=Armillaria tabescens TaxID=1929756 RepID=A0AA39NCS9_ARMTA|nr:uncharacterized protein EV420DRAFT_1523612 [Desarmillaria tabescens]KAK0463270.1 hypothetical protein EV420DRAFT_1523612 [Desarmillaria tabescens]